ncbi:ACT domain-containing protein [Sinosporangium album]|uniref:ACT domain-containing protein n=1 Tax=Sinosporangium album TaxID=504805 RepID=A0A1G8DWY3_9ACTN|nr:ACT domain-containing protein [Sinosporangium album]SDH62183.1 ACT domain-containing protein [Sinosporangium album]
MSLRVRVSLPDRPGALGQVARVLGALGADILHLTVLERETGRAVDDFTVAWPGFMGGEDVADRLAAVPGVRVEGVWPTREMPGAAPDYDLLRHVAADPARACLTLVDALPGVVAADWAVILTPAAEILHRSMHTPDPLDPREVAEGSLGLQRPAAFGWDGRPSMGMPLGEEGLYLVVARTSGPPFHRAEVDRAARVVEIISLVMALGARNVPVAAEGV